ncbi:Transposase [Bradyrhizobium shewense]|uniref:Transposase n=1 Tax=Bradyrhizobium shewense TaxID=1761772 RepID=A0A1C3XS04_9BRAD|nr:Transposase [Bradyrhizobium shewense]
MKRRKIEAVKLVRERGVSVAQAGRDLDVHENVLRKWVKEFGSDPVQAFPGPPRPDIRLTTRHFDLLIAAAIAWQMRHHATKP